MTRTPNTQRTDRHYKRWFVRLGELERFVSTRSRWPRWTTSHKQERSLGVWVTANKSRANSGGLDARQQAALMAVPGYTAYKTPTKWEDTYAQVADFIERTGTHPTREAPVTPSAEEKRLAIWCSRQRGYFKDGTLSEDRQSALEALPFWAWSRKSVIWKQRLASVLAFIDETGKLPRVSGSAGVGPEEAKLGNWLRQQRTALATGSLSTKRLEELKPHLEVLCPPTSVKDRFTDLEVWLRGAKSLPQRSSEDPHERALACWLTTKRTQYRRGGLPPDQAARLEAIDGWVWEPMDRYLIDFQKRLDGFLADTGRWPRSTSTEEQELRLVYTLTRQRQRRAKGTLPAPWRAYLEGLEGWHWDARKRADPIDLLAT